MLRNYSYFLLVNLFFQADIKPSAEGFNWLAGPIDWRGKRPINDGRTSAGKYCENEK
jgi:hypothetical protein